MTGQENNRPNELIEHAPVTLRRYRAEDVDALFGAVTESLDDLRPWMPWAADYSRASAEEYLAGSVKDWDEGTAYNYAIVTGDALVGSIGLMNRSAAGRGMSAAPTAPLVGQAFGLPGVDWVEIVHDELNVASGQIPRKLGFTEAGRRPLDFPSPSGTGTGVVWRLTR